MNKKLFIKRLGISLFSIYMIVSVSLFGLIPALIVGLFGSTIGPMIVMLVLGSVVVVMGMWLDYVERLKEIKDAHSAKGNDGQPD